MIAGRLHDQFVVDVIQGGAGTSTNMNANEVIANRALERMGHARGRYELLHPNDHVNASQSTNDVYPTALRLAAWSGIGELMLSSWRRCARRFEAKAAEFADVLKIGRTQLQDAVPMTLGQEFLAYAVMIGEDEARLDEARALLTGGEPRRDGGGHRHQRAGRLRRGGRAAARRAQRRARGPRAQPRRGHAGHGRVHSGLRRPQARRLQAVEDLPRPAAAVVRAASRVRATSCLPARQAGSSIMPGKVNPVIPEVMNQVAFEVIGNDITITMAAEAGQLQLNAFEPIIAWSLHKSVRHLRQACLTLRLHCVEGIRANRELLARRVAESATLATALGPLIGYDKAALCPRPRWPAARTIASTAHALGVMSIAETQALLVPGRLTQPASVGARPLDG